MHPTRDPRPGSTSGDGTWPEAGATASPSPSRPHANAKRSRDTRNRLCAWAWFVAGLALVAYGTVVVLTPEEDGGGLTGLFVIVVALPMFWIARDTCKRGPGGPVRPGGGGGGPTRESSQRNSGPSSRRDNRATGTASRSPDTPELASALQEKLRELGAVRREVDRLHERLEFSQEAGSVIQEQRTARPGGHAVLAQPWQAGLSSPGTTLSPTLR